jgi:hypothetical protein
MIGKEGQHEILQVIISIVTKSQELGASGGFLEPVRMFSMMFSVVLSLMPLCPNIFYFSCRMALDSVLDLRL